jgi:hypothetical protein
MKNLSKFGNFLLCTWLVIPPSLAGEFIDQLGKHRIANSPWMIECQSEKGITFGRSGGFVSTALTPKALPKAGWFVYVQDDTHAWAFDGESALFLCEVKPSVNTLYQNPHLPYLPPDEVMNRLPKDLQKVLRAERK